MPFALASIILAGCVQKDKNITANKVYISSDKLVGDLLIGPEYSEATRSISVRLAQPMNHDVEVTFEARPDLTAEYNMIYGDQARMLPSQYYDIPALKSLIRKGAVAGEDIVINFSGTPNLDNKCRYVLPVRISDSGGADVLKSSNTAYFVFKPSAQINVVADISRLRFPIKWSATATPMVTGMRAMTVECLFRVKRWDPENNGMGLASLLGREGIFLIRIGDSGYTPTQPQIVGSGGGNWPSAAASPKLPTDEWVHFAFVLNTTTRTRAIYVNGVEAVRDANASNTTITFPSWSSWSNATNAMSIGYAYESTRYFPGMMSEFRIWNVERTPDQLKGKSHYLDPTVDGDGLVAYWKFNEGSGNVIHDFSGNGTDIIAEVSGIAGSTKQNIEWVPVELYQPK